MYMYILIMMVHNMMIYYILPGEVSVVVCGFCPGPTQPGPRLRAACPPGLPGDGRKVYTRTMVYHLCMN